MGNYEVEIAGVKVKVSVIDHAALIDENINELTYLLQRPIVGIDVKFHVERHRGVAKLLILCVGTRCLVIQLARLSEYPDTLKKFLSNEMICFVGFYVNNMYIKDLPFPTGVEVGELAARVLKNPKLIKCVKFTDLVNELGVVTLKTEADLIEDVPKWNARVFSEKEITRAIYKAYTCYLIGNRMLSIL